MGVEDVWDRPRTNKELDSIERLLSPKNPSDVYASHEGFRRVSISINNSDGLTPEQKKELTRLANRRLDIYSSRQY